MVGFAFASEMATSKILIEANTESNKASNSFQGSLRNAEVVSAMGMAQDIRARQGALFDKVIENYHGHKPKDRHVSDMTS